MSPKKLVKKKSTFYPKEEKVAKSTFNVFFFSLLALHTKHKWRKIDFSTLLLVSTPVSGDCRLQEDVAKKRQAVNF